MNDVRLVLLDMDGTLLDGDSKVPASFKVLVETLKEKGVSIGIATGRPANSIRILCGDLFNEMACVTTNGTANYLDGKLISQEILSVEACKQIIKCHDEIKNEASLQIFTANEMYLKGDESLLEILESFGIKGVLIDNYYDYLDDVVLISVTANDMKTNYASKFTNEQGLFKFADSGYGCLDFMPPEASKASGAKKLAEELGIEVSQIMALGDADNDLEMLAAVGYPVAMANGNENVKRLAKYQTTKTNEEEGALEFLKEFFGLE